MRLGFKNIPKNFPLRTMVNITWFFSLTFTVLVFLMNGLEYGQFKTSLVTQLTDFSLMIIINYLAIVTILLFYINNIRGIRLAVYAFFVVVVLGSFPVILVEYLLNHLIRIHAIVQGNRPTMSGFRLIIYAILNSILLSNVMVSWQVFVLSQVEKREVGLENAALKTANSEAKNRLLLQQIHPHFLFNALTTVKSLIYKQPDVAVSYVVKLSNFLRVSMTSTDTGAASLEKEISFCRDYLQLQKVRLGDALVYSITIAETISDTLCLPVFSLQALVENAIKHNSFSESAPMHIAILVENGLVMVKNDYRPHNDKGHSLGSGLLNLSERYERLTGEKILISKDALSFYVGLKLFEGENSHNRG